MGVRDIYIREIGDFVKTYHLGEFIKGNRWKEQSVFANRDELVDYLRSDEKYAVALRKRGKNLRINIDIEDNELVGTVIEELKNFGFKRTRIMSKQIKK